MEESGLDPGLGRAEKCSCQQEGKKRILRPCAIEQGEGGLEYYFPLLCGKGIESLSIAKQEGDGPRRCHTLAQQGGAPPAGAGALGAAERSRWSRRPRRPRNGDGGRSQEEVQV